MFWNIILLALICVASFIDIRHLVIPNSLNLALLVAGLAQSILTHAPAPFDALIGVLAGGGLLAAASITYRRVRGVDGLGFGDVKFVGAAGAWVGWAGIGPMLLCASLLALIFIVLHASYTRSLEMAARPLPFAPFLAAGLYAAWLVPT